MSDRIPPREDVLAALPGLLRGIVDPGDDPYDGLLGYLNGVYELGRALHADPALAALPEVQLFQHESRRILPTIARLLGEYLREIEGILNSLWEDDEAFVLCRRRSTIAFLVTPPSTEELDERLRDRWLRERVLVPSWEVPDGIPPEHWWWRHVDEVAG